MSTASAAGPRPALASRPASDAYALLGVLPDASPDLALAMYWRRVAELRAREVGGDPGVIADLQQLNDALSSILHATTSFPAASAEPASRSAEVVRRPVPSARRRVATFGGLAMLLLACGSAAAGVIPPVFALVGTALWLFALGRAMRRPAGPGRKTPFAVLQLGPHATADDVDLAYRTLVSRWLGRLTVDPVSAIRMLDAFEQAYPAAMEAALARVSAPVLTARRPAAATPCDDAGMIGKRPGTTGPGERKSGAPDIERRLSAAFQAVGDQVPPASERSSVRFAVVIEAAAGNRRIPLEERPITVGAGGEFDISVGATPDGDAHAHARLWVSGQDLVLHAASAAACRVNGVPSSWARLESGDLVEIAGLMMRVAREDSAAADA